MKDTRSTRLPNLYWSLLELVVSASCTGNTGNSGTAWHVRRISGTAPRDDTPAGHGRPTRGGRDDRFRKSPQKKPIGTRCHRLLEGEACRLVQSHPRVGVGVRGTAFSGDGGVPGDEVPQLRCDGRKHAACAIVSSIGYAGQSASAPGPRALPHL